MKKGLNESDIYLLIQNLERDLQALRIRTVLKPSYNVRHAIDEKALQERIQQHVKYSNEYALFRDVDSISGVIRSRAGRVVPTIERSGAVFVTSNTGLATAANEFHADDGSGGTPVAISDWDLTNLLWLKEPQAARDLPRKQIIADFYAAMQPDDAFRRRYLEEVEKLEKKGPYRPEDVYVLRHSLEARSLALDLTVGDEKAFTQGTVAEVLEIVKERMEGEARSRFEQATAESATLREELSAERGRRHAQATAIRARAAAVANRVARSIVGVAALMLALALYVTFPIVPGPLGSSTAARWMASLLVLLISVANWVWGTTVISLCRRMELALEAPIQRFFCWMAGVNRGDLTPGDATNASMNRTGFSGPT